MDGRPDREIKGLADTVPGIETQWKHLDNGSKYKVYSIPGDLALGVRVTVHDPERNQLAMRTYPTFPAVSLHGKRGKVIAVSHLLPTSYPKYPKEEKGGGNTEPTLREEEGKVRKI